MLRVYAQCKDSPSVLNVRVSAMRHVSVPRNKGLVNFLLIVAVGTIFFSIRAHFCGKQL